MEWRLPRGLFDQAQRLAEFAVRKLAGGDVFGCLVSTDGKDGNVITVYNLRPIGDAIRMAQGTLEKEGSEGSIESYAIAGEASFSKGDDEARIRVIVVNCDSVDSRGPSCMIFPLAGEGEEIRLTGEFQAHRPPEWTLFS